MTKAEHQKGLILPLIGLVISAFAWYKIYNPSDAFKYELMPESGVLSLNIIKLYYSHQSEPVMRESFSVNTNYGTLWISEELFDSLEEFKGYNCSFHFKDFNKDRDEKLNFSGKSYKPDWYLMEVNNCKF
jgi:hypothetical protein